MVDAGAAYLEVQQRFSALVASLGPEDLARPVPACPEWTVAELVAHHAGVASDLANGHLPELGDLARIVGQHDDADVARDRDQMTSRQVEERREHAIGAVLDEWASSTSTIVAMMRGEVPFPEAAGPLGGAIAINDIVVHEGDALEALGRGPAPEGVATSLALGAYGFNLDSRIRAAGLPALALSYGGKQRVLGGGDATVVVTADRSTLVRLLASRLTIDQILALSWTGDPTPYLEVIPEYGPAAPRA